MASTGVDGPKTDEEPEVVGVKRERPWEPSVAAPPTAAVEREELDLDDLVARRGQLFGTGSRARLKAQLSSRVHELTRVPTGTGGGEWTATLARRLATAIEDVLEATEDLIRLQRYACRAGQVLAEGDRVRNEGGDPGSGAVALRRGSANHADGEALCEATVRARDSEGTEDCEEDDHGRVPRSMGGQRERLGWTYSRYRAPVRRFARGGGFYRSYGDRQDAARLRYVARR